jgi:hypothetical protein
MVTVAARMGVLSWTIRAEMILVLQADKQEAGYYLGFISVTLFSLIDGYQLF